jgi:hypothetical protein
MLISNSKKQETMKRIFFVIIVLLGITTSCTKNFESFNTDTKRPVVVPASTVFANAQKALSDQEASTNVNLNVFKLWSQQWTETTYPDEANYDVASRNIARGMQGIYYRDVLNDFANAKSIVEATVPIGDIATAEKANQLAIIDILQVYTFAQILEIFGNMPYTEAVDINNIYPVYDDALTVYKDLLTRLDEDIASMDDSQGSFGDDDLYMQGDVAMWKKFANSMKVRIGITIADGDDATAKAAVESGYAGAFAPTEKCQLVYLDETNANPLYLDMVASGRHDFVPANTLVDAMNAIEDPRRASYFTLYNDSIYLGGPYGVLCAFSQYSHVADAIQEPTFPSVLLDGTEVAFYLAEAAERGYSVGKTAKEYYDEGITSSFVTWGLADEAAAYLAKPEVNYTTAEGTWKQKIGTQAWFAYYVRGLAAWTTWRRLDYPILNMPPNIASYDEIPKRFSYSSSEATLNPIQYQAAASAIGGDDLTTKLFWDKY